MAPGLRILKFGGAALRDGAAVARAAAIAAREAGPKLLVVSAMEGVTDRLETLQDRVVEDESHVMPAVDELRSRHKDALRLVAPADGAAAQQLDLVLLRLERLLFGLSSTKQGSPRLRDLVLSFGERLAAPVVAAALRAKGHASEAFDAERAGLRTLGPFGQADPDMPSLRRDARAALMPPIQRGEIPVVTGFFGVDAEGHTTIFGRGGSDYVAAILADALDATAIELWKDVPGFLAADPRMVPDAQVLAQLGYAEAAELAQFGAKVLHPRAVEPAQARSIPIVVRGVQDPSAPGTIVSMPSASGLASVACRSGVAIVRLRGPSLSALPGVAHAVFGALRPGPINVLAVANTQTILSLAIEERDVARTRDVLAVLPSPALRSMEVLGGRSLVCVVGSALAQPGNAARVLAAVAGAGVDVEMVSLPANEMAFDFVVPSHQAADAVRAVHAVLHTFAGPVASATRLGGGP